MTSTSYVHNLVMPIETSKIFRFAINACEGDIQAVAALETIVLEYISDHRANEQRMRWHVFADGTKEMRDHICYTVTHCTDRRAAVAVFSILDAKTIVDHFHEVWFIWCLQHKNPECEKKNRIEFFTEVVTRSLTVTQMGETKKLIASSAVLDQFVQMLVEFMDLAYPQLRLCEHACEQRYE